MDSTDHRRAAEEWLATAGRNWDTPGAPAAALIAIGHALLARPTSVAPGVCGDRYRSVTGDLFCELPAGHAGQHQHDQTAWSMS